MFSFKNFVPVKNRVRVRVKGLGLVFRDRVRIRNIIGGAAGAHISMTSYTFTHVWLAVRKTPVFMRGPSRKGTGRWPARVCLFIFLGPSGAVFISHHRVIRDSIVHRS